VINGSAQETPTVRTIPSVTAHNIRGKAVDSNTDGKDIGLGIQRRIDSPGKPRRMEPTA
jgi:hypothetical protein